MQNLTMAEGEEVKNKQVVLKDYVSGFPKETDMVLKTGTMRLKVPRGVKGVVVKNLYLSCDPYMRARMSELAEGYVKAFTPGSPIAGLGVAKVLDSGDPSFNIGDLVWGLTGWEEYNLITATETIQNSTNRCAAFVLHRTSPTPSYVEDIAEGLESAPAALFGLFSGRNIGKQVVVVARE
ncbi:hypothetical protein RJ640_002269 [Escallonia rubra]|uniref:Oxidoreductase N-terminal domain-containing protein n=1 Tax=Escallonia rubra TaxID=112253 RepID=A0AA88RD55_9ASTE|nr:hypothetical protein RJ640_002269 [Escallonia rubra]